MSDVPHTELLKVLQKHGRTEQADRDNLVQEILTLAQYLHLSPVPDGVGRGAIGGLLYNVQRLYEQFECHLSVDELAARYAEVELRSFAKTDDEVDEVRQWAKSQCLIIRAIPVECPDGTTRHMFASHMNQTSVDGKVYQEGEFIHNPTRFPPPFEFMLLGTPYERIKR